MFLKFKNLPHGPAECAVLTDTPDGHYLNAREDKIQVISVGIRAETQDYEASLPGYRVMEITSLETPDRPDLLGRFVSVIMKFRG